jgi:poly-gamma-glutamate synthesis protein (capsule biosynthesis protein)
MYELPSPRMTTLFRGFIDMGADAVINHHTHCVSGYEVYNSKPIFYSIGNFLFDSPKERNSIWNFGQAVSLKITKSHIAFNSIYFKQCNEEPKIILLDINENEVMLSKVISLNTIIKDAKMLEVSFQTYCHSKSRMYNSYLEPHKNKYVLALQNRKWFPTFWSSRKKLILENLIRCESHRDAVLKILKK